MNKLTIFTMCLIFTLGCSTTKYISPEIIAQHKIKEITINIVENTDMIAKAFGEGDVPDNILIAAFYDHEENTIWVPRNPIQDENGRLMPNLFLLGHELWHAVEPDYHSITNVTYSFPVIPLYDATYTFKKK